MLLVEQIFQNRYQISDISMAFCFDTFYQISEFNPQGHFEALKTNHMLNCFSTTSPILYIVSLDRAHQDLKLNLEGITL